MALQMSSCQGLRRVVCANLCVREGSGPGLAMLVYIPVHVRVEVGAAKKELTTEGSDCYNLHCRSACHLDWAGVVHGLMEYSCQQGP